MLGALGAAWLAFAAPLATAAPVDPEVQAIFADDAYEFCHEPSYPLTPEEASWCPMLQAEGSPMCPAFPDACKAPRAALRGVPGRLATREADKDRARGLRSAPDESDDFELPDLGGLAVVLFWVVILGGALALAVAIATNVIRRRAPSEPAPTPEPPRADTPEHVVAASALPTDIDVLLAAAHQAELHGDFARAIDYGHAALLRRLEHEGVILLHRSRTTGDYLSDLRAHVQWRSRAAPVMRDIDRAQFGARRPDSTATRRLLERIVEIVKGASSAVGLVLLVIVVVACDGLGKPTYRWDTSPSGCEAAITLLRQHGHTVSWRAADLTELEGPTSVDEGPSAIVLLRGAAPTTAEWDALHEWVKYTGGTLVVADDGPWPKWIEAQTVGDPYTPIAWERDVEWNVESWSLAPGEASLVLHTAFGVSLQRPAGVYVASRIEGQGVIVVLADDHLFTNAALATGTTDVVTLFEQLDSIELVDGWTGLGADSPMASIEGSHLTAALAQLFLLVLALLAWRGRAFGRRRDPAPAPSGGFADHARSMGLHYASARASGHAVAMYSAWALEALRQGVLPGTGLHGLSQGVAQRTGREETDVMRILVEAHSAAATGRTDGTATEDMNLLRELVGLVRECGGK